MSTVSGRWPPPLSFKPNTGAAVALADNPRLRVTALEFEHPTLDSVEAQKMADDLVADNGPNRVPAVLIARLLNASGSPTHKFVIQVVSAGEAQPRIPIVGTVVPVCHFCGRGPHVADWHATENCAVLRQCNRALIKANMERWNPGFGRFNPTFKQVERSMEENVEALTTRFGKMDQRVGSMESRIAKLEQQALAVQSTLGKRGRAPSNSKAQAASTSTPAAATTSTATTSADPKPESKAARQRKARKQRKMAATNPPAA